CTVPDCGSAFRRSFNLKPCICGLTGEKPWVCQWPGCGQGFARPFDCRRHEQLHTSHLPVTCDSVKDVKKSFTRMDALSIHIVSLFAQSTKALF
ncbi:hypothetical protein C8J56DRAFT_779994, partial [Mycena floridula]